MGDITLTQSSSHLQSNIATYATYLEIKWKKWTVIDDAGFRKMDQPIKIDL